jgi:large subunit ribosomal protein L23
MSVIVKPLITEKTNQLSERLNQYAFVVEVKASKPEIIAEVEKLYNVEVDGISTMLCRGKRRTRFSKGGVIKGKKSNFKKAIITLKNGAEIDFFENV